MKVLHVDDEVEFRELVSFFLGRQGDFEVEAVETAREALDRLQSQTYDAIVVDYSLPDLDGIELLKILRAQGNQIPFILFTGRGREDTAALALNNGADFYLEKGVNPQAHFVELANMISQSVHSRKVDEDIARSERFLSDVFSSIQDGVSILGKDLTIIRVNRAMERWYSHKMPLVGKKCYDAYHGREARCESCPSIRTIEKEESAHEVVPKIGPDGVNSGWLDLYSFPMRDSITGELSGVIEYVRDITDRRKAELELQNAHERLKEFQQIIDKGPAILFVWQPQPGSPVSFVSDSISQFGYKREDFVSTFVYDDIIHKDDLEREREEFRDLVKKGATDFLQEYRIVTKSGEVRWVADHTYVRRNPSGNIVGYEGIVIDVTDRRLALEKSQQLASRLQAIVEAFPDLYFHVGADGTILDFNAGHIADLYVPPQKLLGRKMQEALPPEVGDALRGAFGEALKTGRIVAREYTLEMAGEIRFYEARLTPIAKEQMLIVVRNITARRRTEEALRHSESGYRQLADSITDIFFALDKDMRYTYWNKASEALTGIPSRDAVGKSFDELFPNPENQKAKEAYVRVFNTKEPANFTNEYRIGGKSHLFEIAAYPIENGVSVITKDVTVRRRAEDALKERDIQFKKLSHHVPGMLYQFVKRPDGTYCVPFTSEAIRGIFGCSPKDVLEDFSPIAKAILSEDLDKVVRSIEESAARLTPWQCEYRVQIPGKTVRWVLGQSTPEKLADGSIVWYGYNTDITERKQAEEMLKASEEKYRQLVDLAQEGIISVDADGTIRFVNPRMAEMLGYSVDEMTGRPVFQFMGDQAAELARRKLDERKLGQTGRYELDFMKKDGTSVHTSVGAYPLKDKDTRFLGSLAVVTDVTDRKRYEEALEVANQKLNLLGQVTRHDALNQLAILVGWLQIAQETEADKMVQGHLKNVKIAADTIRRQLDFTGDYQKMGVAKPRWIDAQAAYHSAASGPSPEGVAVSAKLEGVKVYADPMFEKVLSNLMDNSIRHGEHVSKISISYEKRGGDLVIVYEDDGVGILESDRPSLFERGRGKHTGFGLFMAREILAITGICINETGQPGKGARFELLVPAGNCRIEHQ